MTACLNAAAKLLRLHTNSVVSRHRCDFFWFSTSTTVSSSVTLKSQLRELYKKIHPDLFHQYPEAKDANERSFKMLQEYMEAARKGGETGGALLPYNFEFYLRNQSASGCMGSLGAEEQGATSVKFERVTLSLPPPSRRRPGEVGDVSRTTRKALDKLLKLCGVISESSSRSETDDPEPAPLTEFVPQAVEVMLQRSMQQSGPRQQISTTKLALQFGRQVSAGFALDIMDQGAAVQLRLLQDLVAALDKVPDAPVSGVHFMFGDKYGVDSRGRVWLDANHTANAWARHLAFEADLSRCQDLAVLQRQHRTLERNIASIMGLSSVYCLPALEGTPAYRRFLERLAAESSRGRAVPADIVGKVAMCVRDGDGSEGGAEASGNGGAGGAAPSLQVDTNKGQVFAHVESSAQQVYDFLEEHASRAAAIIEVNLESERNLAHLRRQVERKLRLRRLIKDEALDMSRFRAACLRLLHHSAQLMPLMESLPLRISSVSGVAPDGSFVNIPWDFTI